MITYTKKKLVRLIRLDFVRFCIVGGLGFAINFLILTILHSFLNWPLVLSQLLGSEIALFCNFILHHNWTYKGRNSKKTVIQLLLQFHMVSWPAILGSTVMVGIGVTLLGLSDLIALAASSIIALAWNFLWSKYVVWRSVKPEEVLAHIDEKEEIK